MGRFSKHQAPRLAAFLTSVPLPNKKHKNGKYSKVKEMWHLQGISIKNCNKALFSTWILVFKETDHSHYSRLRLKGRGREVISLDVRKPLWYLVFSRTFSDSNTNSDSRPLYIPRQTDTVCQHTFESFWLLIQKEIQMKANLVTEDWIERGHEVVSCCLTPRWPLWFN